MRPRISVMIFTLVAALTGAILMSPPTASATDPLANPSAQHNIGCSGAWSTIQVDWRSHDKVTIRWSLKDTMADGKSPVLRIAAVGPTGTSNYIFRGDKAFFALRGGQGSKTDGKKSDWNPGNVNAINHLRVTVESGTYPQGIKCRSKKNIFNWSRIAYHNALQKRGAGYEFGGTGPEYDCSGLVYTSYNPIRYFPGWPVRSSIDMWNWARSHSKAAKFYAKPVPFSKLKIGDLIFYKTTSAAVGHVAFYAGGGRLYDAHTEGVPVGYHDETQWWKDRRVAAYRIIGVAAA